MENVGRKEGRVGSINKLLNLYCEIYENCLLSKFFQMIDYLGFDVLLNCLTYKLAGCLSCSLVGDSHDLSKELIEYLLNAGVGFFKQRQKSHCPPCCPCLHSEVTSRNYNFSSIPLVS